MTTSKAITNLEEFLDYKKRCLNILNQETDNADFDSLKKQLVGLYESDKKTIDEILLELKSTKNDT